MEQREPIRFAEDAPRSRSRLGAFGHGALGTLAVLLGALLVYGCWLTWVGAQQGAAAFRYINEQLAAQQAQQAQQRPSGPTLANPGPPVTTAAPVTK